MILHKLREKILAFESKIASISMFITAVALTSKLLGFFKIHLIARIFSTSKESDIFYAAFALPDLVFALLVVGTVNAALVPIFIKILKQDNKKVLFETLNTVIVLLFGLLIVILGGIYIALPSITSWIFSSKDVLKAFDLSLSLSQGSADYYQALFINLSRLMLVSPLLLAISSVIGAYLQAHKRFITSTLASLMYNVGIVLGIFGFVKFAPHFGIYSLSYSVLLGTFLHFITQLIGLINLHEKDFSWSFNINNYVKDIAKLSLPRIFGLGVEQIAIMFNTFWGFTLGTGALSVFKFASTLHLVPVDLISGSFLQVIFPRLNEKAHENDNYESLRKLYWKTLQFLVFISIPIIILFIVLRLPIVRLVFGAGRFTWTATVVTSFTLAFFAPSILLQALAALNIRTFYAINNTKTPLMVSMIGVTLNILFSILFTNFFSHYHDLYSLMATPARWIESIPQVLSWFTTRNGSFASVAGLAFGITLGLLFEVVASFILLSRKIDLKSFILKDATIGKHIATLIIASISSFAASYLSYRTLDRLFDTSHVISVVILSGIVVLIGGLLYLLLTRPIWSQYDSIMRILRLKKTSDISQ